MPRDKKILYQPGSEVSAKVKTLLLFIPAALLIIPGVIFPLGHMGADAFTKISLASTLWQTPWIQEALSFTIWQATLSSILSVSLGIPVSLILANRSWPLRRLLLTLSALPFALPSVLVAFAFVMAYGRSSILGIAYQEIFGRPLSVLYAPHAIIAAHVFFNLPLAVLHLTNAIETVPIEHMRSARLLNLSKIRLWRSVIWPHILPTIATLVVMIAILCLSSFAIVLLLGGGPQTSTLEVAIYQLLRFDADSSSATIVAFMQLLLLIPAVIMYRMLTKFHTSRLPQTFAITKNSRNFALTTGWKIGSAITLLTYATYLILPLLGLVFDASREFSSSLHFIYHSNIFDAVSGSLRLAIPSSILCVFTAWMFASGIAVNATKWPKLSGMAADLMWLLMGVSPTVLTLGWIVFLSAYDLDPYGNPYPTILLVHTLLALPICVRILAPHSQAVHERFSRSAQALDIRGFKRLRFVEWPEMKQPLIAALSLAFAFSLGDVSCVLMFGSGEYITLPTYIFNLMGAYRFGAAALSSVALALVCLIFFWFAKSSDNSRDTQQ